MSFGNLLTSPEFSSACAKQISVGRKIVKVYLTGVQALQAADPAGQPKLYTQARAVAGPCRPTAEQTSPSYSAKGCVP